MEVKSFQEIIWRFCLFSFGFFSFVCLFSFGVKKDNMACYFWFSSEKSCLKQMN